MPTLKRYEAIAVDGESPRSAAYREVVDLVGDLTPLSAGQVADRWLQAARDSLADTESACYLGWHDGKLTRVAVGDGEYAIVWPASRPGRPVTVPDRKELRLSVSSPLRDRLRAESARRGVSDAFIVREALETELARRGG